MGCGRSSEGSARTYSADGLPRLRRSRGEQDPKKEQPGKLRKTLQPSSASVIPDQDAGDQTKQKNKELQAKLQFLAAVPLMKRLPKNQHPLVVNVMGEENFDVGDAVIRQGEVGDAFYIIRKGEARIHVVDEEGNEQWLTILRAGDYFGENALLRDEPRMASVFAETALNTFMIKREQFQELGLNRKLQFANRRAVVGGTKKLAAAKDPTPKTAHDYRFIARALKRNPNLETMIELAEDRVKSLIDVMWREEAKEGQEVITKGQLDADYFYIVQEGVFDVFGEDGTRPGELKRLATIGPGGSFGEVALLYLTPRDATVVCKEDSQLWVIDRVHFKQIMMQASAELVQRYMGYIDRVAILDPLAKGEKEKLAQGLVEMLFTEGEDIIEEGDLGTTFYILYDGTVQIIKDKDEVVDEFTAEDGLSTQFFGERALLQSERRAATVRVASPTAKVLCIDRETFVVMLGPLKDLIESRTTKTTRKSRKTAWFHGQLRLDGPAPSPGPDAPAESGTARGKIHLKDLQKVAIIGYGAYSKVELWEHKADGKTYALKRLSRWHVNQAGTQESVWNEKEVLMDCESPFIVTCYETYASKSSLCFLLEACLGGDLHTVYSSTRGLYGSVKCTTYYTAGAVCAIEHLHMRRVIYRDLKPENMMLTSTGHLKLTDFGLSKFVVGKTYTTCGTPDYLAPEMIRNLGHTIAVDWWALGILIFELMAGNAPFTDVSPLEIYNKVAKGIEKVTFPAKCQGDAEDLVVQLLRPDPSQRLPMRKGGTDSLKMQTWFLDFDWAGLEDGTLPPPYQPLVTHNKDLSQFNPDPDDHLPQGGDAAYMYEEMDDSWTEGFATA